MNHFILFREIPFFKREIKFFTIQNKRNYQGGLSSFDSSTKCIRDSLITTLKSIKLTLRDGVILFSECDFGGAKAVFTGSIADMGEWRNKTKSIKIKNGYGVIGFTRTFYLGDSFALMEGINCLDTIEMSNRIASLVVLTEKCVAFFKDCYFKDTYRSWCDSDSSIIDDPAIKDQISSFRVPDGKIRYMKFLLKIFVNFIKLFFYLNKYIFSI